VSRLTEGAAAGGAARSRALAALCLTEIVSYGVLFYAFPVLATDITGSTGWSRTAITAAYSAGNLIGALAGIPAGRLIDRYGPRPVMTAGSVLGAAAAAGIAIAPSYGWFVAAWLLAGVAMAGLFYPPAFAALTGWYGPDRVRALTILTLAAGFSSTIFAPLTAALATHLSWRGVYLVLAAVLAATTIPAHGLTLGLPWPEPAHPQRGGVSRNRQVLTSRVFLLLASSLTLSALRRGRHPAAPGAGRCQAAYLITRSPTRGSAASMCLAALPRTLPYALTIVGRPEDPALASVTESRACATSPPRLAR
jgi:MFS family permease